jgi:hypothetical protein
LLFFIVCGLLIISCDGLRSLAVYEVLCSLVGCMLLPDLLLLCMVLRRACYWLNVAA